MMKGREVRLVCLRCGIITNAKYITNDIIKCNECDVEYPLSTEKSEIPETKSKVGFSSKYLFWAFMLYYTIILPIVVFSYITKYEHFIPTAIILGGLFGYGAMWFESRNK